MTTEPTHNEPIVFTVEEAYEGKRLDLTTAQHCRDFSRSLIKAWIEQGQLSLNETTVKNPRHAVHTGDTIILRPIQREAIVEIAEPMDLNIVWEDEHLLILNKPAGLVVHPGAGNSKHTLMHGLLAHHEQAAHLPRAGIVHRLDKDTSGLLVVAKNDTCLNKLSKMLKKHDIQRHYLALVTKTLSCKQTIRAPIGRHPYKRTQMAIRLEGKEAVTHFRVQQTFARHSLLAVQLETGRTHQIRVHFAHKGFPIVGDPTYGRHLILPKNPSPELQKALNNFKRQALHAARLCFIHPITQESIDCAADMPEDMGHLIDLLEQHRQNAI